MTLKPECTPPSSGYCSAYPYSAEAREVQELGSGGTGDLSSAGKEGRGKEEGRKGLPIGTYAGRD